MRERSSWRLRLDGRGKGRGAACAGPLPLPFSSVGPCGRPLVGPGGWARYLRTASGSVGPRWCKANEGALLCGAGAALGNRATTQYGRTQDRMGRPRELL